MQGALHEHTWLASTHCTLQLLVRHCALSKPGVSAVLPGNSAFVLSVWLFAKACWMACKPSKQGST